MAETTTTVAKQFSLNLHDAVKSTILAVIGAALTTIEQAFATTPVHIDWKAVAFVGLGAGVSFLIHNFFDGTKTVTITTPQ